MVTPAATPASSSSRRDQIVICSAAFLRSLGVGLSGVLLAIYLNEVGWNVKQVGLLVSAGLAGNAAATLFVSFYAEFLGRRRTLLILGALNVFGGASLMLFERSPAILMLAAFFGMVNGLGRDRGPAYALEQAILPETTTAERRTFAIAWYSLLLDAGLALGSLLGGIPYVLKREKGWGWQPAYESAWIVYTVLLLTSAALYVALSSRIERVHSPAPFQQRVPPEIRSRVFKLAALTGMDSFGGGFLTGALISYWFFRRFELGVEWIGPLFFAARVANAISHLVAAWLARRIGLLNTMVFTHIPSSLFLIAVPFAPSAVWAAALFLAREALVEMDVPTRQSYILAVVPPQARAFSSGITTFTRNVAYATAPGLAGAAMSGLALSVPLLAGGGIKILYDFLLFFSFRKIKPPEEAR